MPDAHAGSGEQRCSRLLSFPPHPTPKPVLRRPLVAGVSRWSTVSSPSSADRPIGEPAANRRDPGSPREPGGVPGAMVLASRLAPVQEKRMKVALIVLWTLAAGVGLFLMVRSRIVTATAAMTRDAAEDPGSESPPDPPRDPSGPA